MNSKKMSRIYTIVGISVLAILILMAVFAPIIAPYDPYKLGIPYERPSAVHLLGTNDMGQDILSEIIYGARVSLIIGVISAIVITILGAGLGMLGGYCKGRVDKVISAIINITLCIPSLPLTVILAAYLGSGLNNLILAISITAWTGTAKIIRAKTMQLREMPFVQIEKNLGVGTFSILIKHILPNLKEILLMRASLSVASAILSEASLSFLGLGMLTEKSWGNIIHYAFFRNGVINGYWWWIIPPIIMITITIMSFVFIGYYGQDFLCSFSRKKETIKEV